MDQKELIKVFVMTGSQTNGLLTHKRIVDNKTEYYGYAWDIFNYIKYVIEYK